MNTSWALFVLAPSPSPECHTVHLFTVAEFPVLSTHPPPSPCLPVFSSVLFNIDPPNGSQRRRSFTIVRTFWRHSQPPRPVFFTCPFFVFPMHDSKIHLSLSPPQPFLVLELRVDSSLATDRTAQSDSRPQRAAASLRRWFFFPRSFFFFPPSPLG